MDDKVVKTGNPVVSVTGSPGIGKSVISYAWVVWYTMQHNRRTLYLHYEEEGYKLISIVDGQVINESYRFYLCESSHSNISKMLNFKYEKIQYDLIVSDGADPVINESLFVSFDKSTILTISSFKPFPNISQEALSGRYLTEHQVYA